MTATKKIATTKSSASVDVQQKPVKIVSQPLDGRDALKALKSGKAIRVPEVEGVEFRAPRGKTPYRVFVEPKAETKKVSAKSKKTRNGVPASKTPEARIARRNMRNMLKALTLAADESQDAEVREYAEQRAAALAEKLGIKQ